MREEFGIHELAVEDLSHPQQRPKLEDCPDQVLLIVHGAKVDESTGRASLHEVDIIAGKGWALTFHGGRPLDSEELARRIRGHPELFKSGSGFLLYVILDELVDTFFPALDLIGGRVEDLEEAIFEGLPNRSSSNIYELRKDLIAVRRVAGPMRDAMVVLLRRDLGLFTREAQRYLQDVYDHLIRVVEQVEDYQDLTANALDVNLEHVVQPRQRGGQDAHRLRRHLRGHHPDHRHLRHELPAHAGARLALRLRLRHRSDDRRRRRPVGLLPPQALAVTQAGPCDVTDQRSGSAALPGAWTAIAGRAARGPVILPPTGAAACPVRGGRRSRQPLPGRPRPALPGSARRGRSRFLGDEQLLADLLVGPSLCHQRQHLASRLVRRSDAAGDGGASATAAAPTWSSSRRRPRWASNSTSRRSGPASSATAVW
jgi:CorA-like Mg2+ transporter protein